jgi:hypothetical protein
MEFRTVHTFERTKQTIEYTSNLLSIGSCFAAHMGSRLKEKKFSINTNPSGIIYNPMSIAQTIESCIHPNFEIADNSLFENGGFWHSWNHHGSFSNESKTEVIATIKQENETAHLFLKKASHLLITLGSAFVYEKCVDGEVVANCHKVSGKKFVKRLLEPNEIIEKYLELIKSLRELNPNISIIWSISPVKHIRDGLHENNLSKSVLFLALNQLIKNDSLSYYFPAFELVQDELRDYRFYKEDMAHPSDQAIEYVWKSFVSNCFSTETKKVLQQIEELQQAMAHRPIRLHSEEHKAFKANYLKKVIAMKSNHPYIDLTQEESYFTLGH